MKHYIKKDSKDAIKEVARILELENEDIEIIFEKGEYIFSSDSYLNKEFYHLPCVRGNVSISFLIEKKRNLIFDGGGSLFLFQGRVTPFIIDRCENIVIKNLFIDFERPFFSQGDIVDVDGRNIKIRIDDNYPYRINDGKIEFYSDNYLSKGYETTCFIQEFNSEGTAPSYNGPTIVTKIGCGKEDKESQLVITDFTNGFISLYDNTGLYGFTKGNKIVICHEDRDNSGMHIFGSKDITVENFTLYQSGGFGITCTLTENIIFNRYMTVVREGSERILSINADSIHGFHCMGDILVKDCVFENMMDDGVNIHGLFYKVIDKTSNNTVLLKCMINAYGGINPFIPSKPLRFYKGKTFEIIQELNIVSSKMKVEEGYTYFEVKLDGDVQNEVIGGLSDNYSVNPKIHFDGVKIGNNRPRGILVQTPLKCIIENSIFYTSLYAIHVVSDSNVWYESGRVEDLLIRNNKFLTCNYNWGEYPIMITPEYEKSEEEPYCHRNIRIIDNYFESFTGGMVMADGVDGLVIKNNQYVLNEKYKKRFKDTELYKITNSRNVEIE